MILEDAPHVGPAGLDRRGAAESAVRVVQSLLGVGGASELKAVAAVALLESLQHVVAFQASGADPAGLADLIVKAARN